MKTLALWLFAIVGVIVTATSLCSQATNEWNMIVNEDYFTVIHREEFCAGHTLGGLGALWDNRVRIVGINAKKEIYEFNVSDGRDGPKSQSLYKGDTFRVHFGQVVPVRLPKG